MDIIKIIERKAILQGEWSEENKILSKCEECSKNRDKIIKLWKDQISKNNLAFKKSLSSTMILDPRKSNREAQRNIDNAENGIGFKACEKHSGLQSSMAIKISQIIDLAKIIDNYQK